jgi:hypothetical protein
MLVGLPTAQAADTTLTCKGTKSWETSGARKSSEGVNIGITVDLQNKTLVGLEPTVPLRIDVVTETTISFSGPKGNRLMNGILDSDQPPLSGPGGILVEGWPFCQRGRRSRSA